MFAYALLELLVAAVATWTVWGLRRRRPLVFLLFPLLGFLWGVALHGLFFFADGSPQPGMLIGFGCVMGLFLGVPLGTLAGLVAWALDRLFAPKS